jgi:hypothetical protein
MFAGKKNNLMPIISDKFRRSDNGLAYLFTNARDEPNISEWVAHHLLLGFDKVIVFDHLSKIPIAQNLGTNFDGKVVVKRVQGTGNIKLKLMTDAVRIATDNNISWMLYLDADEFLLLNNVPNIKDFLKYFKYADAIGINWLFFGTSNHVRQPKGLITENFIKSEIRLNKHVKSFVRPHTVQRVDNPHFYIITNPSRYYSMNGTRMRMGPFNNQPLPFIKTTAYIAHYYTQSEEEHLRRKSRELDDGSVNKAQSHPQVHKVYNNVFNNQLQNKYSKKIKEYLQKNNIVL